MIIEVSYQDMSVIRDWFLECQYKPNERETLEQFCTRLAYDFLEKKFADFDKEREDLNDEIRDLERNIEDLEDEISKLNISIELLEDKITQLESLREKSYV